MDSTVHNSDGLDPASLLHVFYRNHESFVRQNTRRNSSVPLLSPFLYFSACDMDHLYILGEIHVQVRAR